MFLYGSDVMEKVHTFACKKIVKRPIEDSKHIIMCMRI